MDAGAVLDILSLDSKVGQFTGEVEVVILAGDLSVSSIFSSSGVICPCSSKCLVTFCRISCICLGERLVEEAGGGSIVVDCILGDKGDSKLLSSGMIGRGEILLFVTGVLVDESRTG
jgi:hypothetical protein